jgi:hypothetical protein
VTSPYINTAFAPDGTLKPAYCHRLGRVLAAADVAGIIVIANYFYWRQLDKLDGDAAICRATEEATKWMRRYIRASSGSTHHLTT